MTSSDVQSVTEAAAIDIPPTSLPMSGTPATPLVTSLATPLAKKQRLTALDAWRGLTVMLMLLVNNVSLGENTPAQLTHAHFGSATLTDMVFPWFLFCAGASLPYSHAAMQRAGVTGGPLYRRLLSRAVLMYLMGAFVTSVTLHAFNLGLGVLQLIALATFFGALLGGLRGRLQAGVAGGLLLAYGLFLTFGHHAGGVGIVSETANPAQAVNSALYPYGLRGLISVIPTTALVLLGSLAARFLQQKNPKAPQKLLAMGVGLSLLGWAWAALGHMPLSKTLWTPSYILLSGGLGTLGILLCWLIADSGRLVWRGMAWGPRLLGPLTIPGRNSLAAYVLPIVIKVWILQGWQVGWAGNMMPMADALLTLSQRAFGVVGGGWAYTLGYVLAVWLMLAWMARRDMIWKL